MLIITIVAVEICNDKEPYLGTTGKRENKNPNKPKTSNTHTNQPKDHPGLTSAKLVKRGETKGSGSHLVFSSKKLGRRSKCSRSQHYMKVRKKRHHLFHSTMPTSSKNLCLCKKQRGKTSRSNKHANRPKHTINPFT